MTSKLTREKRVQALYDLKAGQVLSLADIENVKMLSRMALAAMDSDPVIIVGDDGGDALSYRRLIQSLKPGTKLYRHPQPAPVVPVENHIGSKNALDAIISFIKGKSNPTVKCYEEVSEQLFKDNCHGIHSHVIEYILKLGEELEDLRAEQAEMQPVPVVPVCTCRSGDGSLRWPCPLHPGNSPVVPDGIRKRPYRAHGDYEDGLEDGYADGWNAYRAAMLAAAPQEVK